MAVAWRSYHWPTAPPSANMAPEYGATCGIFPVDAETLRYLDSPVAAKSRLLSSRPITRSRASSTPPNTPEAEYTATPRARSGHGRAQRGRPQAPAGSRAAEGCGRQLCAAASQPARPHRQAARVAHRSRVGTPGNSDAALFEDSEGPSNPAAHKSQTLQSGTVTTTVKERFGVDPDHYLDHGSVVIAAITSCTNTSNPSVMMAAGILAKKAVEKGLTVPPWVKTSLAPGSRVVTDYYAKAGLLPYLEKLRFNVVGYGCTTCIGNSGPLPADVSKEHRRARAGGGQRAQRQPQLRGPRERGRARQLPDEPAAGGGLRAGRQDRPQLRHRSAGHGPGRPARLPAATSGPRRPKSPTPSRRASAARASAASMPRCQPWRRQLAGAQFPHRRRLPVGAGLHLHPPGALLRRHGQDSRAGHRNYRRARAGRAGRLGHHRPHLAGRQHQGQRPGRQVSGRRTA